jgi:hypothetical protein
MKRTKYTAEFKLEAIKQIIKKSLITVGLVMIWGTSTNYFAVHFTNIVGHWIN